MKPFALPRTALTEGSPRSLHHERATWLLQGQPRMPTASWKAAGSDRKLQRPLLCWMRIAILAVPAQGSPKLSPRASQVCGDERNRLCAHTNVFLTWLGSGKSKQVLPESATTFGPIAGEFYFLYVC